ncbi:hypothetical protein Anas_12188 [Armadillidium nasatum]|uniref:Uncharacterized protein n=1 Tax=Armadillidium nasatum TaxID=96803 RepID=A0A5N5T7D3_9CRUS|nr:hypothetical protein Anas_12188 [Armadillidium nasatum]
MRTIERCSIIETHHFLILSLSVSQSPLGSSSLPVQGIIYNYCTLLNSTFGQSCIFYSTFGTLFYGTVGQLREIFSNITYGYSTYNSLVQVQMSKVGELYGQISGENSEVIITRFFGIFFLFFQSSQVWGNLISSTGGNTHFAAILCVSSTSQCFHSYQFELNLN